MILDCKNSTIPNNIRIASYAFRDCVGLTTLTLPKKVYFEDNSIYGCTNLDKFICTGTNPSVYTFGYMLSFPKSQIALVVPHQALANYESAFSGFKAIESDPSSVRKYYISDLALGTGGTSLDNFTDIGKVATVTNPPAFLSSSTNYLMSHAITDVRLVKAEYSYWLKNNLVIDGKTYTKGKGNGFGQTGSEYHVYYTTEGSNEYGTPLLASLEIEERNRPCEDNGYIGLVKIDEKGNVIEKTSNADWNELESHAYRNYIYVKGIYDTYKIPTNKIHYITTNNQKIDFASSAFGANLSIESNDYSEGQGIIVFDDVVSGELANAFAGNDKLSYVILPDGINGIGNGAFEDCSALTGITASKVYHIGDNAFKGCASLEKATLSEWSVTDMGTGAFEGCTSLQSVSIPSSITTISEGAFK